MRKSIQLSLLFISIIMIFSTQTFAHGEKQHNAQPKITTNSVINSETNSNVSHSQVLALPTAEELILIEQIKKDHKFRKSLIPYVMTGNILVLLFAFWVIVTDRRKNKKQ